MSPLSFIVFIYLFIYLFTSGLVLTCFKLENSISLLHQSCGWQENPKGRHWSGGQGLSPIYITIYLQYIIYHISHNMPKFAILQCTYHIWYLWWSHIRDLIKKLWSYQFHYQFHNLKAWGAGYKILFWNACELLVES